MTDFTDQSMRKGTLMSMIRCFLLLGWVLVIGTLLSGCGGVGQTYKNLNMNFAAVQSIAVMPFENLTSDDDAAARVRDAFMGMLQATEAMYVLPPGEVQRGIERTNVRVPEAPTADEVKTLGKILNVEAVLTGVLREYGPVRSGQSEANIVSLSLQMMETETGTVVWSGASTQGGITLSDRMFGGGGEPMNKVTEKAVNDLLDQLFE
jgi:TolB-like protein